MRDLLVGTVVVAALVLVPSLAPSAVTAQRTQPRPEDVQAAAAAFAEAQRAQIRGEYAQAADLFELADRSAPNAAALRSAIRNHRAAGHASRAATLALRARALYPADADTQAVASEVIEASAASLGRLRVMCEPACSIAIDGGAATTQPVAELDLFVDPGTRALVASWPGREPVRESLTIEAGAERTLELRAPEPAVAEARVEEERPAAGEPPVEDAIAMPAPPPPADRGITPVVFGIGAGLTAVALGVGIWSGVDTLDARDAYEADPTRAGYEDGVDRQWRTNGLFIGAAALGVATLVVALFTDWGGAPASEQAATDVRPWVLAGPEGAVVGISQSFGGDT